MVDYSKYFCRSWQELYFTPRVVRYIRILGTFNTLNKVFHVVSLEAYYTKRPFQVDKNGILSFHYNVQRISGPQKSTTLHALCLAGIVVCAMLSLWGIGKTPVVLCIISGLQFSNSGRSLDYSVSRLLQGNVKNLRYTLIFYSVPFSRAK